MATTTPIARPRLFRHPGRVAVVVVALLAVANLGLLLLDRADTSQGGLPPLPSNIESVTPERGSISSLQDTVSADLSDGLTGVLVIDGQEVPEDELDRVPELGIVSFRPGSDRSLTKFAAGTHQVVVLYWSRTKPRPAKPGSYAWTFRASA